MEMTFPHPVIRQRSMNRQGHRALLAAAIARQANSPTARAVWHASNGQRNPSADAVDQRIHYFASADEVACSPSGAFLSTHRAKKPDCAKDEVDVYQDASAYGKAVAVDGEWTGERSNQTGIEQ